MGKKPHEENPGGILIVEFEKEASSEEVQRLLRGRDDGLGVT